MNSVFCQFCEQPATTTRAILCNDRGESVVRNYALCQEHGRFYEWMYGTLAESAKQRMQIQHMQEGKMR